MGQKCCRRATIRLSADPVHWLCIPGYFVRYLFFRKLKAPLLLMLIQALLSLPAPHHNHYLLSHAPGQVR